MFFLGFRNVVRRHGHGRSGHNVREVETGVENSMRATARWTRARRYFRDRFEGVVNAVMDAERRSSAGVERPPPGSFRGARPSASADKRCGHDIAKIPLHRRYDSLIFNANGVGEEAEGGRLTDPARTVRAAMDRVAHAVLSSRRRASSRHTA